MTKVGEVSQRVIDLLSIDIEEGTPIYIGKSNVMHMSQKHKADYRTYRKHLSEIIKYPDYIGLNPNDDSIEYIKIFETNSTFVKVAIRVSANNVCYARTIYARDIVKLKRYVSGGHLIKY